MFPMSMARFFGLLTDKINMKVVHAVHMYAVYSLSNQRRFSKQCLNEVALSRSLWQYHRQVQLIHNSLISIYREVTLAV